MPADGREKSTDCLTVVDPLPTIPPPSVDRPVLPACFVFSELLASIGAKNPYYQVFSNSCSVSDGGRGRLGLLYPDVLFDTLVSMIMIMTDYIFRHYTGR